MRAELRASSMLIGGGWSESASGKTFEDRDPATGEVNLELPDAGPEDAGRAVEAARAAQAGWEALGGRRRGELLLRLAELIEGAQDSIAQLEAVDNGRPLRETASQARIVARWYRYYAGMADKVQGATIPVEGPYLNYTRRVAVGVCAAITPWNHPMLIATKKIAPALACGNTVVVKPSELAPLSVLELGRLALEAGLPDGVLNIVTGGRAAGEALVAHPDVNRVDLTGSTATGIAIAREAAATMKRVGLELGGKAANLIFADADVDRAAAGAVFAGYIAQGQSCVAGARVLVERPVAERVAEQIVSRLGGIAIGDPLEPATEMGPVITPVSAARIRDFVDEAVGDGAELRAGGSIPAALADHLDPEGFVEPTLLWTEDPRIRSAQEEIFGPVVSLIPFESEDEAVEIANDVPFGLGGAVWTGEVSRAHRVADRLRAGIVWVNDYHRIDPASPWGGFGLSGYGRENGFDAVLEYTETKSTWVPLEEQSVEWYGSDDGEQRLN